MLKDLIKLANHLDSKGLTKEADIVDNIIKRSSPTLGPIGPKNLSEAANYIALDLVMDDEIRSKVFKKHRDLGEILQTTMHPMKGTSSDMNSFEILFNVKKNAKFEDKDEYAKFISEIITSHLDGVNHIKTTIADDNPLSMTLGRGSGGPESETVIIEFSASKGATLSLASNK